MDCTENKNTFPLQKVKYFSKNGEGQFGKDHFFGRINCKAKQLHAVCLLRERLNFCLDVIFFITEIAARLERSSFFSGEIAMAKKIAGMEDGKAAQKISTYAAQI